jgi:hypothetical protein
MYRIIFNLNPELETNWAGKISVHWLAQEDVWKENTPFQWKYMIDNYPQGEK